MEKKPSNHSIGLTQKIFWIFMSLLVFLITSAGVLFYQYFRQVSGKIGPGVPAAGDPQQRRQRQRLFRQAGNAGPAHQRGAPHLSPLLDEQYDDAYEQYGVYKRIYAQINSYLQITAGQITAYKGFLLVDGDTAVSPILVKGQSDYLRNLELSAGYTAAILRDDLLQEEDWFQKALALSGEPYWFQFSDEDGPIWMAQQLRDTVYENGQVQEYSMGMLLLGLDIS